MFSNILKTLELSNISFFRTKCGNLLRTGIALGFLVCIFFSEIFKAQNPPGARHAFYFACLIVVSLIMGFLGRRYFAVSLFAVLGGQCLFFLANIFFNAPHFSQMIYGLSIAATGLVPMFFGFLFGSFIRGRKAVV